MKMKTKINPEVLKIRKGLFFPEDFSKLPEGTFIYISEGILINIEEGKEAENENEAETEIKQTKKEKKVKYTKNRKHKPFTEEEYKFIKDNVSKMSIKQIAKDLKRSYSSVFNKVLAERKKKTLVTKDTKEIEREEETEVETETEEESSEEESNEDNAPVIEFPRKKVQYSDLKK